MSHPHFPTSPSGATHLPTNLNNGLHHIPTHKHQRIRANKQELIQLLKEKDISIASINETLLSKTSRIHIPGYNIIRKERQTGHGGGVAILIRKNIEYSQMDYNLSSEQLKGNEYVTIKMTIHSHHSITVTSVYCPPRTKPSADLFTAISNPSCSLIILMTFTAIKLIHRTPTDPQQQ